jgi:hypothetical protein
MQNFLFDFRFVLRQLRKSPGFSITAVLMLAFGIGATTAIFSIVEGVLLRPLPFPDPSRVMVLADNLQGVGKLSRTFAPIRATRRALMAWAATFSRATSFPAWVKLPR